MVTEADFRGLDSGVVCVCVCALICTCLCVYRQLLPSQSSHLIAGCLALGNCICPVATHTPFRLPDPTLTPSLTLHVAVIMHLSPLALGLVSCPSYPSC